MNIKFRYMSLDEVSSVLAWSLLETSGALPLRENTLSLYPEIKEKIDCLSSLEYQDRANNIKALIKTRYNKSISHFNKQKIIEHYQSVWNKYNDKFFQILSKYFNTTIDKPIDAAMGIIPVCPRNIETLSFYFSDFEDNLFIGVCMHECCHFYFFELCKKIIKDLKIEDYDSPSLLWYLSEISIDAVLNKNEFQKLFSYNFKTYDIFYDIYINGECIVETIKNIFAKYDIEEAIIIGLKYLNVNKEELLRQVNGEKKL